MNKPHDKHDESVPTPRTDAAILRGVTNHGKGGTTMVYKLNDMEAFARQLERELAEKETLIQDARRAHTQAEIALDAAQRPSLGASKLDGLFDDLLNGLENLKGNAQTAGDAYDVGYIGAMIEHVGRMRDLAVSPRAAIIDPRYAGDDPAAAYAKVNPMGGPAVVFRAMASRIEAGEEFQSVLDDYGFAVSHGVAPIPDSVAAFVRNLQNTPPVVRVSSFRAEVFEDVRVGELLAAIAPRSTRAPSLLSGLPEANEMVAQIREQRSSTAALMKNGLASQIENVADRLYANDADESRVLSAIASEVGRLELALSARGEKTDG